MHRSRFLPERQLVFSPELASTLGLEEAILLQHLQLLIEALRPRMEGGFSYFTLPRTLLLDALPFWREEDIERIVRSLADKGVLLIGPSTAGTAQDLVFALNETSDSAESTVDGPAAAGSGATGSGATYRAAPRGADSADSPGSPQDINRPNSHTLSSPARSAESGNTSAHHVDTTQRRAARLPPSWAPSEDMLQLLSLNHNIPRQFALEQLEDFIFYWRERGDASHAWENKFRQHVLNCWRRHQQQTAAGYRAAEPATLDKHWRPSDDALEIMSRAGIDRQFIEEAIPEFILYWRERGTRPKELNSKFVQHIRIQWARYTSSLQHSTEPSRMQDGWEPADDVYDILRMSHIDAAFARSLLPEFIVYWRDSNQVQTSWNSKFLQHVKFHWAKQHQLDHADNDNDGHKGSRKAGRTRDRSLQDDLNDTSWAK